MKKRYLFINLILIMLFILVFAQSTLAADRYSDVSGHWAEDAINTWSDYGIINGYPDGKFRPDNNITRAEMAAIINRIIKYQSQATNTFMDINGNWSKDNILKLNAAKVMVGFPNNYFKPSDNITNQDAVLVIYRALGLEDVVTTPTTPFLDADQVGSWAKEAVTNMHNLGYLDVFGSTFSPNAKITRAEVVTIFDAAIAQMWQDNGLYCKDIGGSGMVNDDRVFLLNSNIEGNLYLSPNVDNIVIQNCNIDGEIIKLGTTNVTVLDENNGELDYFYYGQNKITIPESLRVSSELNNYNAKYFNHSGGVTTYTESGVNTKNGIDVSEHQGTINWSKVAADNVDFAIIRLGWRGCTTGGTYLDIKYNTNMQNAIAEGLDVGVYWFSQATSEQEAIDEAEECVKYLKNEETSYPNYNITYPVVFDWEPQGFGTRTDLNDISKAELTAYAIAFCEEIKAAGYTPMVYSNKSVAFNKLDLTRLTDYDFWFAGYTSYPEMYYGFDMWQYSSNGRVDGITYSDGTLRPVDMNIQFID